MILVSCLTWEAKQWVKVPTLSDACAVFGTGVPQVLELPLGDDDTAGHGGNLPVVVRQRCSGHQKTDHSHDEAGYLYCRRHGCRLKNKITQKTRKLSEIQVFIVMKSGASLAKNPEKEQKCTAGSMKLLPHCFCRMNLTTEAPESGLHSFRGHKGKGHTLQSPSIPPERSSW